MALKSPISRIQISLWKCYTFQRTQQAMRNTWSFLACDIGVSTKHPISGLERELRKDMFNSIPEDTVHSLIELFVRSSSTMQPSPESNRCTRKDASIIDCNCTCKTEILHIWHIIGLFNAISYPNRLETRYATSLAWPNSYLFWDGPGVYFRNIISTCCVSLVFLLLQPIRKQRQCWFKKNNGTINLFAEGSGGKSPALLLPWPLGFTLAVQPNLLFKRRHQSFWLEKKPPLLILG